MKVSKQIKIIKKMSEDTMESVEKTVLSPLTLDPKQARRFYEAKGKKQQHTPRNMSDKEFHLELIEEGLKKFGV